MHIAQLFNAVHTDKAAAQAVDQPFAGDFAQVQFHFRLTRDGEDAVGEVQRSVLADGNHRIIAEQVVQGNDHVDVVRGAVFLTLGPYVGHIQGVNPVPRINRAAFGSKYTSFRVAVLRQIR